MPGINNGSSSILPYFTPHNQPLKMEQIKCSETSAFNNQTPGKYPKDYTQLMVLFAVNFLAVFLCFVTRFMVVGFILSQNLNPKIKAVYFSEMLVPKNEITLRHKPQVHNTVFSASLVVSDKHSENEKFEDCV